MIILSYLHFFVKGITKKLKLGKIAFSHHMNYTIWQFPVHASAIVVLVDLHISIWLIYLTLAATPLEASRGT